MRITDTKLTLHILCEARKKNKLQKEMVNLGVHSGFFLGGGGTAATLVATLPATDVHMSGGTAATLVATLPATDVHMSRQQQYITSYDNCHCRQHF